MIIQKSARKPLIIWSLCVTSTIAILFGFSEHPWQILVIRAVLGAADNFQVLANVVISELDVGESQVKGWCQRLFAITSHNTMQHLVGVDLPTSLGSP